MRTRFPPFSYSHRPELLSHPDVYTIYMINPRHKKLGRKEVEKERGQRRAKTMREIVYSHRGFRVLSNTSWHCIHIHDPWCITDPLYGYPLGATAIPIDRTCAVTDL